MRNKIKVFIKTYGCQMNERDSDNLAAQLEERGHTIATTECLADAIVVNTCSVREIAEQKAIGKLQHIVHRKSNGFPVVGVMGCMAQNLGKELIKHIPTIDFIAGARQTPYVIDMVEDLVQKRREGIFQPVIPKGENKKWKFSDVLVNLSDDLDSHNLISKHSTKEPKSTAFISIMQGCSMNCSYCIVPKTRGIERSRTIESIVDEANILVGKGVKEISVLGQVVNSFGRGTIKVEGGKSPFVQLLYRLNDIDGLKRIRFMSPHPSFFRDDLINAYGELEKLCEYVHLPLQSGSDKILKDMNRPYSAKKYLSIVEKLREVTANKIAISTDIIVGYPNESEEDFQSSVDIFKKCNFDMAYIFKYSPRAGTPSAELNDNISDEEKERRNQILLELLYEQSLSYNKSFIGKIEEVLVEGKAKRGEKNFVGRTRTHRKVVFSGELENIGELVNVKIESATVSTLEGKIC